MNKVFLHSLDRKNELYKIDLADYLENNGFDCEVVEITNWNLIKDGAVIISQQPVCQQVRDYIKENGGLVIAGIF